MGRRVHDSKRQLIIYFHFLESWRVGIVFMSLSPSLSRLNEREGEGETHECPFHTYISWPTSSRAQEIWKGH